MILADFVFWGSGFVLWYIFIGYPLTLMLFARVIRERPVLRSPIEPHVSLIISAYNEENIIGQKLENSLALDYQPDKLEIVVVSDASTDRTDSIVESYGGRGVILKKTAVRRGKTGGLNEAVAMATGEIVILSDANALYAPDAIRKLVRNFSDASIACVTGDSRYFHGERSIAGENENKYWEYERFLKIEETKTGSIVGSDGAIMAVRKEQFVPLRVGDISDFVTPLQILSKGYRSVFEPEAVCYESTVSDFTQEFRRKVRVVNRSWNGLFRVKVLLNPLRYGWVSVQLVSHKLLRWLTPIFLIGLFVSSFFCPAAGILLVTGQIIFYSVAVLGLVLDRYKIRYGWLSFPAYFLMINVASAVGIVKSLCGEKIDVWEPERPYAVNSDKKSLGVTNTN